MYHTENIPWLYHGSFNTPGILAYPKSNTDPNLASLYTSVETPSTNGTEQKTAIDRIADWTAGILLSSAGAAVIWLSPRAIKYINTGPVNKTSVLFPNPKAK